MYIGTTQIFLGRTMRVCSRYKVETMQGSPLTTIVICQETQAYMYSCTGSELDYRVHTHKYCLIACCYIDSTCWGTHVNYRISEQY